MSVKKSAVIVHDLEELRGLVTASILLEDCMCDLNHFDVSRVTDMSGLFENSKFDGSIAQWDVSNVVSKSCMFRNSMFQGDLSTWNVSNV